MIWPFASEQASFDLDVRVIYNGQVDILARVALIRCLNVCVKDTRTVMIFDTHIILLNKGKTLYNESAFDFTPQSAERRLSGHEYLQVILYARC